MVSVTGNFTSRAPLAPEVLEAISIALSDGWADPRKLSQAAHRAATLKAKSIEVIANSLAVPSSAVHICGEPALLPFLAITGFLKNDSTLITSEVDQGKVRAVAQHHSGPTVSLKVDSIGTIEVPHRVNNSVLHLQTVNGESGIRQDIQKFSGLADYLIIDATRDIPTPTLAANSSAVSFDASSWNGPQGIGFLVINNSSSYRYPLPHIAPISVPGSYSLPLLIGAAAALEKYTSEKSDRLKLRIYAEERLSSIENLFVIQGQSNPSPHYISALVSNRSSEEVLRSLNSLGFDCDAGSACSPQALAPSHVIAAMGLPTTGHLRFTLHDGTTKSEIDSLVVALNQVLNS